jgi:hypothetical protein
MKIVNATGFRCPLPFQQTYRRNLTEILYLFQKQETSEYGISTHRIIKFDDYLKSSEFPYKFNIYDDEEYIKDKGYAYAFSTNLFKTNVLMLDFDLPNKDVVDSVVETITNNLPVQDIDITLSSRDSDSLQPLGYHLYVGLTDTFNILNFYKLDIPGTCPGFINCALLKQATVLRVSRKFSSNHFPKRLTEVKWIQGYSKRKDEWLSYGQEQLTAPLTTAVGAYLNKTQQQVRPRLRMRG